eukprot:761576-Hanusia_phi.AAC.2
MQSNEASKPSSQTSQTSVMFTPLKKHVPRQGDKEIDLLEALVACPCYHAHGTRSGFAALLLSQLAFCTRIGDMLGSLSGTSKIVHRSCPADVVKEQGIRCFAEVYQVRVELTIRVCAVC